MIGRPSDPTFLKIDNKLLTDCPVTRRDISIANAIFGPDIGSLKCKTARQGATRVETTMTGIPATIMSHYWNLVLGGNLMFVNKILFFTTISRHSMFGTCEQYYNKTTLAAIKQVKSVIAKRGFQILHMLMDGQFESLQTDLADLQINLNTVSNGQHVPEI
jgi:hypothetical protein